MFPSVALELLAGKVASTCGDVRRALDISRRVIELAEVQNQAMPLQPTVDHGMCMTFEVLMLLNF
jgi:Cdc6-like AAA superfamily ATPase